VRRRPWRFSDRSIRRWSRRCDDYGFTVAHVSLGGWPGPRGDSAPLAPHFTRPTSFLFSGKETPKADRACAINAGHFDIVATDYSNSFFS
jgi:hypothetical protein